MNRIKSFDATGIAPNGYLYSGDLNAIQDATAAQTDFGQTIAVGALAVGESGLQLLHFGSGEARISGALRTDGIFRGLGGVYAGAFTTTQRNAIALGSRPYGLLLTNTTTNQLEWNTNTDASPTWYSIASDGAGYVNVVNGMTLGGDTTLHRNGPATIQVGTATQAGTLQIGSTAQPGLLSLFGQTSTSIRLQFINGTDTQPTFTQLTNGVHNWGPGGSVAPDTSLGRTSAGVLTATNTLNAITGYQVNGTALAAAHLSNGVTGTGAIALANAPTFTGVPNSVTPPTVDNSTKVATTAWVIAQGYVSTTGIAVSSVFGRTGAITAQANDYTAAQVTNAADKAASATQTFTGNVGAGGAPTVAGGGAGTTILSAGGVVASRAAGGTILSGTVPGDTVYRIAIDNTGLISWSTGGVVSDTSMGRTAAGVITATSYLNALNGFQVNGVALAASHLSNGVTGSGAVVLATNPGLLGSPTATTAATTDNSTRIATTAFINSLAGTISPIMDSAAAAGTSQFYSRQDHVHPSDTSRAALSGATFTGTVTTPTLNATSAIQRNGAALGASHLANGVTGNGPIVLQNSALTGSLTNNGILQTNGLWVNNVNSGGLGYTTGAGSSATCAPNSSCTCNAYAGRIALNAVAAGTDCWFEVLNSVVGSNDTIIVHPMNMQAGHEWITTVFNVGPGNFFVYFFNGNSTAVTPSFNFTVIKGTSS